MWLNKFLIVIVCCTIHKIGYSQIKPLISHQEITIVQEYGRIEEYLNQVEKKGVVLAYSSSQFNSRKRVRIPPKKYKIDELLIKLFEPDLVEIKNIDSKLIFKVIPKEHTIYGFVYDEKTREVLPGATLIFGNDPVKRVKTDDFGHYSTTMKLGKTNVFARYTGYSFYQDTLDLKENKFRYDFVLSPQIDTIQTIVIINPKSTISTWEGNKNIANTSLRLSQSTLGAPDLIKALQLESGVNRGSAGSGELSIRGGSADQNLILLDGIPVYNYSHLFGLSSIFSTDILKNTELYTGSFPARYDGRLSSVIDIKTKDGDMYNHHGSLRFGILDGSLMFEGPIVKEKSSYMLSLRRSWLDLLKAGFSDEVSNYDAAMLDFNLKFNYKLNPNNRIFLSTYYGYDDLNYENKEDSSLLNIGWKNRLLALKWHSIHQSNFTHHSTLVASEYYNNFGSRGHYDHVKIYNKISDIGLDNEFRYYGVNNIIHSAGLKIHRQQFESVDNPNLESESTPKMLKVSSMHTNAYIDNEIQVTNGLSIRVGINYTNFSLRNKSYNYFQPRTSVTYQLKNHYSFYTGYAKMAQFYNQISLGVISLPMELRVPSTKDLAPQQSIIYEVGYKQLNKWIKQLTAQIYYKNYHNIIQYRNYQSVLGNRMADDMLDRIVTGLGVSKGIEITAEENIANIYTKLSYTYSKTKLRYPEINDGEEFSPRNDFRHVITGAFGIDLKYRWKLGANFRVSSGQLINIPLYTLSAVEEILGNGSTNDEFQVITHNTYRIGFNYDISLHASWTKIYPINNKGILSFGIQNITHRPMPIFTSINGSQNKLMYSQIYPLRFVPHISYSYAF